MTLRLPRSPAWLRLILIFYGGLLLLWLGSEDRAVLSAVLLASGFTILISGFTLCTRIGGQILPVRVWFMMLILTGLLTGIAAVFASVLLMFFKTSWHAHPYPDYEPQIMLQMLERIPAWAAAGVLVGLALALLPYIWHHTPESSEVQ